MAPEETPLTIGKLASAAGVGVETIRFYERENLLPEPPRKRSGYRQYPPDAVARVLFIRRAKELCFSLKEITELLELRVDPNKSCADVRELAKAKIVDDELELLVERPRISNDGHRSPRYAAPASSSSRAHVSWEKRSTMNSAGFAVARPMRPTT